MARCVLLACCAFWLASFGTSVLTAQTGEARAKETQTRFYWCWSAQLRRNTNNDEKHYYSNVFQGTWTVAEIRDMDDAFHNYLRKTYPADADETGIGPGVCGSYLSRSYAESSREKSIVNTRESERLSAVETGWTYGGGANSSSWIFHPTEHLSPPGTMMIYDGDHLISLFSDGTGLCVTWWQQPSPRMCDPGFPCDLNKCHWRWCANQVPLRWKKEADGGVRIEVEFALGDLVETLLLNRNRATATSTFSRSGAASVPGTAHFTVKKAQCDQWGDAFSTCYDATLPR